MIARMKADMAQHDLSGTVSHGVLFLKVGEEDLVEAFVAAIKETFGPKERGAFDPSVPMSLEAESGYGPESGEFETSSAAFAALCQRAAILGVHGTERYKKDVFLGAIRDAFRRSRLDARATNEVMPYAKSALNSELKALYTQLDAIGARSQ